MYNQEVEESFALWQAHIAHLRAKQLVSQQGLSWLVEITRIEHLSPEPTDLQIHTGATGWSDVYQMLRKLNFSHKEASLLAYYEFKRPLAA